MVEWIRQVFGISTKGASDMATLRKGDTVVSRRTGQMGQVTRVRLHMGHLIGVLMDDAIRPYDYPPESLVRVDAHSLMYEMTPDERVNFLMYPTFVAG